MGKQDRPTVFISFNNKSKDFVDSLYSRLSTEATREFFTYLYEKLNCKGEKHG